MADPETRPERLLKSCRRAEEMAKSMNMDILIFENCEGNFIEQPLKWNYVDIKMGLVEPLYVALAKFCVTKGSLKRVAWKLKENHTTR